MDSTPWYGSALVAGGFALLGLVLGMLATYMADRRKFKREDDRRFHDPIRQTGAQLVTALLEARRQLKKAMRSAPTSPEREVAVARHKEQLSIARGHQDNLKFIASRLINDQALAMISTVSDLGVEAREEQLGAFWPALDTFTNAVRAEIGLPHLKGARRSTL